MEYKINDSLFCILQSTCIRNIAFPGYFLPTLGLNALAALTAPWQSSSGFLDCLQTMITLFQISLKPEQIGFNKTSYSHDSSETRPIISLLFRFLKFFKFGNCNQCHKQNLQFLPHTCKYQNDFIF